MQPRPGQSALGAPSVAVRAVCRESTLPSLTARWQMTRWSLLLLFLLVPLPQAMLGATGNIAIAELPDSLTIRAVELRPGERDTALAGPRSRESAPGAAADTQSLPEAVMEQHLQTLIAPVVEKVGVMGLCFAEHSRSICVSGVAKLQFR